jgi:Tfp pilus assembly protein FimT
VLAILTAATMPSILSGLDRARAIAAARSLAQQCAIARFHAVGQGRYVALHFTPSGADYRAQMYADGNRNGVRLADVAGGVDRRLGHEVVISDRFRGVRIGLDPSLGLGAEPVRLSGSTLLSFSPIGTATAGTVYVLGADGTQLAVRVLGATGRTRVLWFERSTSRWQQP